MIFFVLVQFEKKDKQAVADDESKKNENEKKEA